MSRALQQADALFDLGRYEQAAALAAQHLAGHPDDATALVLLARCRHRLGDEQQALTTVEHALRVAPESVSTWLTRTHILLALKEYEQAEGSARRAVELAPQHWASHYTLGMVLDRGARRKRKRAAYESARRAVALAPEESDAHVLVGLTAHHTGNHRVAQQRVSIRSTKADHSLPHMRLQLKIGRRFQRLRELPSDLRGRNDYATSPSESHSDIVAVQRTLPRGFRRVAGSSGAGIGGPS